MSNTSRLTSTQLVEGLRALGIRRGEVVHVQSDLLSLGLVDTVPSRENILKFYLDGLLEAIGPEGTVTTCTSFEDYGRYAMPYVREESPSRTGALSEYIRTRPGAIRSIHPIMSVTGLGKRAAEICSGNHYDGFGYASPWGSLHRANAHILTLGMGAKGGGTTFFHYVEKLYGVPYQYTKIYNAPVFSEGKQLAGPFTLSVRYLDFDIENTPVRVKTRLVELGEAKEVKIGTGLSWSARAQAVVDRMMQMFDDDRWVMLERPPKFRPGVLPMDGVTGELRTSYNRGE